MIKFFELEAAPCANSIRYDSVFSETDDGYSTLWEPDSAKVDLEKSGENDYVVIDSKRLEVPLMRRGSQWKDCVPRIFGSGTTYLIISQRVADALIQNRMSGFVLYLTDIKINLYSCKKKPKEIGEYYIIRAAGHPVKFSYRVYLQYYIGAERHLDYVFDARSMEEYHMKNEIYLEKNQIAIPNGGYLVSMKIPILSSWDGSDFMPWGNEPHYMNTLFCSRRVVELAHKEQWTNFSFKPISTFGLNDQRFEDMPWPPEIWPPNDEWAPLPPCHFIE